MKMIKMATVAGLIVGLAIALLVGVNDVPAAVHTLANVVQGHVLDTGFYAANFVLAVGLDNLRTQHAEYTRKANDKFAEIREGITPEQVSAIEAEHRTLCGHVTSIATAITTEQERLARSAPTNLAPAPAVTPEEAARAERTRLGQLQEVATRSNVDAAAVTAAVNAGTTVAAFRDMADIATRAQLPDGTLATALTNGTSIDQFRAEAFNVLAQRSNGTRTSGTNVQITRDEAETRRRGMADALVARMARAGRRPGEAAIEIPEHARQWGETGLVEMAAECVGHTGPIRNARQIDQIMQRAAMHSTSDFPAIFQDAVNRRLLTRYQAAAPTYRMIALNYSVSDFRNTYVVRAGDFPSLQEVPETGQIKSGTFSESKEVIAAKPYGVQFGLSRQMIINDNLGAIDQLLGSAGARVTDWENAQVMAKLAANPALLTDGVVVFHASHGNLAGSGTAIDVANVGKARAAMAKQKSLDGILLNLQPKIILTGPDKQTEAEQLLTSITPATNATAVPEAMKRIVPVSDGNVSGNNWYLFADPQIAPVLLYALLEGFEGPRLTLGDEFGQQGMLVKLEHDFGTAAVDYRGGYKNPGA